MAKQRLSKLQKWILGETFEKGCFGEKTFKRYFGHEIMTPAERVTKCRCLKNIMAKGLLEKYESKNNLGRYFTFKLTEPGFNLIANETPAGDKNVSFSNYLERFNEGQQGYLSWANTLGTILKKTK